MAFKMKGFNYPGKAPLKQYKISQEARSAVSDAKDITKDPTTEGTLDLKTGGQDILKEGQHKADRIANFGGKVSELAKLAKGAVEGGTDFAGRAADARQEKADAKAAQEVESGQTDEEDAGMTGEGEKEGDGANLQLSDEAKNKLKETGGNIVSDMINSLTTNA